jgi:signal transduction histidine kinase
MQISRTLPINETFFQSLRTQLLALLGLVLVIALVIIAASIYGFVYATEQDAWQGRQAEAAENAGERISGLLQRTQDILAFMSVLDTEEHAQGIVDQLIDQNPSLQEIILLDAEGNILATANRDAEVLANLFTIPQSNWFLQARDGDPYLSSLQFTSRNEPYVIAAIPTPNGGAAAGRLRLDVLADVVADIQFGDTGRVYLTNTEGQVLAHTDFDVVLASTTIQGQAELDEILQARNFEWAGIYNNFEGQSVVGATADVALTDWIVITEIAQSEAFANSRSALLLMSAITGLFLLVVMTLMTRFLNRLVFKPLDNLQAGAQKIEHGELAYQVEISRHDEMGRVTEAFNSMVSTLQERNQERETLIHELQVQTRLARDSARLKSEFLSTMSHELRTPLNAIEGFTSIMLGNMGVDLSAQARGMTERVSTNSKRLLQLINDFLDLSRIESGRLELVQAPISPAAMAERWKTELGVLAENKGLDFVVNIDPALPNIVYGDEEALNKVTINLLSNAFKFTREGVVALNLESVGNQWTIEVSDTGIGIPPHAREYIFDEFRQVDGTSKRQYGGTGLGLAIVHKLTRAMGGTVSIQSEVGEGSTFTITLPLHQQQATQVKEVLA